MENKIQTLVKIDKAQIQTLVQAGVIPKETPPAQIEIFAKVCSTLQLDPFTKEIYLVGYKKKYSIISGINGFLKLQAEQANMQVQKMQNLICKAMEPSKLLLN